MAALLALLFPVFLNASAEESGNMAVNPGFEEDFVNLNGEPHVLSFKGDWYYNQKDNIPDFWELKGEWTWETVGQAFQPDSPVTPHSGKHCLTLGNGGQAVRNFPMAVAQSGGGSWGGVVNTPMKCQKPERFPRTIKAAAWLKGGGKVVLSVEGVSAEAAYPQGGQGWQRVEAVLPADKQKPGIQTNIQLALQGPGTFDDVSLTEDLSGSPNLAPDPSFEKVDKEGFDVEWLKQQKWLWNGPTYYIWTDWNHFQRENSGGVVSDNLIALSGERSLRFDVLPGDEKFVESAPIMLNQDVPEVVEIGCMVRADRIRLIDLRAVNEDGDDLPCCRPMQPEYSVGGSQLYGAGTFGWRYVRKFVSPLFDRPIKSLRVRLCARGFNGHTLDDGGTRPFCTQVSTVWWDDLRVVERESTAEDLAKRGVIPTTPAPLPTPKFRVEEIDLGEQLLGDNVLRLWMRNTSGKAENFQMWLMYLEPAHPPKIPIEVALPVIQLKPDELASFSLPYWFGKLGRGLTDQARAWLELWQGERNRGIRLVNQEYPHNSWPVILDFDFAKHISYPNENPLAVAINFGVAEATLKKVARLEIRAERIADAAVLVKQEVTDLAKAFQETKANLPKKAADSYENGYPTPFWWVDKTNLLAVRIDISAVKVWPHDQPTRDTRLHVLAYDAGGKTLFEDFSQPFGRMEKFDRAQLPEIQNVKVREDGAVLINGQPKFLTGATHQQQRFSHTMEAIADLGFLGHRLVGGGPLEALDEMWTKNRLYALQAKPVAKAGTTAVHVTFSDAERAAFKDWVAKGGGRNVVCYNTGGWESMVDVSNPETVAQHQKLNDEIRQLTGRPVSWSTSGAYNAWWLNEAPFYDMVHGETEMWGPMDFNVVWVPHQKRLAKRPVAWLYLPQLYENHPIERLRFETYENILRGSVGYSMIQGIGDPTFLRALNGELRYLESRWFSQETAPKVKADPPVSFGVRRKGNKAYIIATNSGPVAIGDWKWSEPAFSGKVAHEGDSVNRMWRCPGAWTLHGWRVDTARQIAAGESIVQYVRIDPAAAPKCVVLGIRGDGQFIHNVTLGDFSFAEFQADCANLLWFTELNHSTWHSVWLNLTPEKYQKAVRVMGQAFADQHKKISDEHKKWCDEHTYKAENFKSLGALPKAGEWHRIEVKAEDLGLVGKWVDGFCFSTKAGKALWDHTAIVRGDQEDVVCDDTVGIDRSLLGKVAFKVEGLKTGAKIQALFEDRALTATDGGFTDDFQGTDTYGLEGWGVTGDNFGYIKDEARDLVNIMPSGYGYNYGPTAVHIYEIPLD